MSVKKLISVFLQNYLDIFYLILVTIVLVLDFITVSKVIEAMGFILIVIGFIISVLPNKKNIKDERISYIKLFAGYISFMISTIVICVFSFLYRYWSFTMAVGDLLRYIILLMYLIFSLSYAITKRIY